MKNSSNDFNASLQSDLNYALLQAKFPSNLHIEDIFMICEATPNPLAAIGMLVGVYRYPELTLESKARGEKDVVCTLVKFTPLASESDAVQFTYNREKKESFYFDRSMYNSDDDALEKFLAIYGTKENFQASSTSHHAKHGMTESYSVANKWSDYGNLYVSTGAFEKLTSTCSVSNWQKYAVESDLVTTETPLGMVML